MACRHLSEDDLGIFPDHRMLREFRVFFGVIGAEVRATALLAGRGEARNQEGHLALVSLFGALRRRTARQPFACFAQPLAVAHDAAFLPGHALRLLRRASPPPPPLPPG